MKIYTKTGDKGETSLIGGVRVPKYHLRIESYGTIDELNSWIGILRAGFAEPTQNNLLAEIQDRLFTIGSNLASDPKSKMIVPDLKATDIELLEKAIDGMNEQLPELRSFILPGSSILSSQAHVARCVCRRAERLCVHLAEETEVPELILPYLNRLSDYLFVLSRFIALKEQRPEVSWKPRNS